jgi:hypothetical protein
MSVCGAGSGSSDHWSSAYFLGFLSPRAILQRSFSLNQLDSLLYLWQGGNIIEGKVGRGHFKSGIHKAEAPLTVPQKTFLVS